MPDPFYTKELGRYLFEVYLERPPFETHHIQQVHGREVVCDEDITDSTCADGIFSRHLVKPLAIRTADCLPVAVVGDKGAALLHVGWRGLQQKLVGNPHLEDIAPQSFFVGPHISQQAFEVTAEFQQLFPLSRHFSTTKGKITFCLYGELKEQVQRAFPKALINHSGLCTHDNMELHSFRRDKTKKRDWNILRGLQKHHGQR